MYSRKCIKTLCLLVAIIFVTAMAFTGCNKNITQPVDISKTTEQIVATTAETTIEPLQLVKLSFFMPPPTSDLSHKDSVLAEVNKLLKAKNNTELDITFVDWGNYQTKINTMLAAGEPFDLFTSIGYMGYTATINKGAVIPIDDLLAKYGKNILRLTPEKLWPAVTIKGKRYGVINVMPYANWGGATYQKELVEKYNFDYKSVKTLKDLDPFLETIKKNEKDIVPLYPIGGVLPMDFREKYDNLIDVGNNFGLIIYDTDSNKLLKLYDAPEYVERLKISNDWYKKGYIAKDAAMKKDASAEYKSKKYAVMPNNGNATEDGSKGSSLNGYPCVDTLQGLGMITTNNVNGVLDYISSTSKNPDRAMIFIDTLFGDKKIFNTLCYGIEGQDYDIVSGAGTDNPTVVTKDPMKWVIWHPWIGEMNVNQWPSNLNDAKALENYVKWNDEAKTSPLMGFVFDPENVKNQIASVTAIMSENMYIEWCGSFPDTEKYITEMKDRLEKAGLSIIYAEVEKQLTEWKAVNGK